MKYTLTIKVTKEEGIKEEKRETVRIFGNISDRDNFIYDKMSKVAIELTDMLDK